MGWLAPNIGRAGENDDNDDLMALLDASGGP